MHQALTHLKQNHLKYGGGIISVCSAQPLVLKTAMQMALERSQPLLIEVTANQVNQFGGYTGMTPELFATFVKRLSSQVGINPGKVVIGADHLGPWVWKKEPADKAMAKAEELLRQCIRAGFEKIHLDTTQGCVDDPNTHLPVNLNAQRSARLCRVAESVVKNKKPLYVIGSDVPLPGGGLEAEQNLSITQPDRMLAELEVFKRAFERLNPVSAWERVIAVVVQPGVDFGDATVAPYRPEEAVDLSVTHGRLPVNMTYEVHAADYQTPQALRQMIHDHFILLKVGPCITYAMRRALYALATIEAELPDIPSPSNLRKVMEGLMMADASRWESYYRGTPEQLEHLRHFSLRDRIRYYWLLPQAREAVSTLIQNLQRPLPAPLLDRQLPELMDEIENEGLHADPEGIVQSAIRYALLPYYEACCRSD